VVTALVPSSLKGIQMSHSKTSKKARPARAKIGARTRSKAGSNLRSSAAHGGTKKEAVVALLKQPAGASIDAIMKATGWQQHSVRGFLAGVVNKRLKLKLSSTKVDGVRVYRIACPESGKRKASQTEPQRR
jgi:transglutaminase/protease-like cytokinesis protein 3